MASLLANQPVPNGRRVGVITNAGGPGILAADALESEELQLPELSEGLRAKLAEALSAEASTRNPVDLIASAGPDHYRHCIETLIESEEVDAVMVIYIPTTPDGLQGVAAAVRETATAHHRREDVRHRVHGERALRRAVRGRPDPHLRLPRGGSDCAEPRGPVMASGSPGRPGPFPRSRGRPCPPAAWWPRRWGVSETKAAGSSPAKSTRCSPHSVSGSRRAGLWSPLTRPRRWPPRSGALLCSR